MVSKRVIRVNEPQAAVQVKNRSLANTLSDLIIAFQKQESLISDIRA